MNISIIGTGLIGGSLAIALKELGIAEKIFDQRRAEEVPSK